MQEVLAYCKILQITFKNTFISFKVRLTQTHKRIHTRPYNKRWSGRVRNRASMNYFLDFGPRQALYLLGRFFENAFYFF